MAKLDLQNYWQVEYPRQRRELNLAIELAEAEIQGNEDQQYALRPYTRFSLGEPFPLTIANLRVCRKAAEIRLSNLHAERNTLIRFHGEQFRILEMRVQAARQRVAELEANDRSGGGDRRSVAFAPTIVAKFASENVRAVAETRARPVESGRRSP